jgi:hypothetical protein
MAFAKSSGVITMNYSYEIKDEEVIEFMNDRYNYGWSLSALKISIIPFADYDSKSFHRTKQCMKTKHPELNRTDTLMTSL